jgi:hypothetical protein
MTTAYTSLLGLALPVTGELSGTWGDTVNNSITSLVDTAVAGTTNVSADSNVTLTTTTGASNQARQAILLFSGARTAIRTVTAPAQSKIYTVINATTGGFAVQLVGAGPTTGVTIANGARTVVAWNGSDFVEVSSPSSIILPGGTANGVLYLNGSKVVTSGSALVYGGSNLILTSGGTWATDAGGIQLSMNGNDGYLTTYFDTHTVTIGAGVSAKNQIKVSGAGGANNINFKVNNSDAMTLTSTGLGIGTSSPASKLHVATTTSETGVQLTNNNATVYLGAVYSANNFANGTVAGQAILRSGVGIAFSTTSGASVQATLDGSGNLGLGVTPSPWGILRGIDIVSGAGFAGAYSTAYISGNAYFNGTSWIYKATAAAAVQEMGSGFAWKVAASGTAGNAVTFTQAMTLDASGNLGVGTTSPSGAAGTAIVVNGKSNQPRIALKNDSTGDAAGDGFQLGVDASGLGCFIEQRENAEMRFLTNATERARITSSGQLLVGATSVFNSGFVNILCDANSATPIAVKSSASAPSSYLIRFVNNAGTDVGAIQMNSGNNGVNYLTLSDYRLKTVIGAVTGHGERLDALEPIEYEWKADGSRTRGFLAHKFQEVYAGSVSGAKDAVDSNGKPQYQAMQAGSTEVIADLVAEIKALRQRVAQLESN